MERKSFRNLRLRPARPALNRGKLQIRVRRALNLSGTSQRQYWEGVIWGIAHFVHPARTRFVHWARTR
jgi:hypothetical protein